MLTKPPYPPGEKKYIELSPPIKDINRQNKENLEAANYQHDRSRQDTMDSGQKTLPRSNLKSESLKEKLERSRRNFL
jgi:hypothetical protein